MGLDEFTRKNLKIKGSTYEELKEQKRENETWDGFFSRVVDTNNELTEEDIKQAVRDVMLEFGMKRTDDAESQVDTLDQDVIEEAERLIEQFDDDDG